MKNKYTNFTNEIHAASQYETEPIWQSILGGIIAVGVGIIIIMIAYIII